LFSIANEATNLDVGGENALRTWHLPVAKLRKLNPSVMDKCAMVFVPPLEVGKYRHGGVLLTPLRNLQMLGSHSRGFYK
jgi:hypothetical protein